MQMYHFVFNLIALEQEIYKIDRFIYIKEDVISFITKE